MEEVMSMSFKISNIKIDTHNGTLSIKVIQNQKNKLMFMLNGQILKII